MKTYIFTILIAVLPSAAISATVGFSAVNELTLEPVQLDSVYIQNKTRSTDTMLVGPGRFDLKILASVENTNRSQPHSFGLSNNYPNSFSQTTYFDVSLPQTGRLTIEIFNILGEKIIQTGSRYDSGTHKFGFDGGHLPSGIYFVRAECKNGVKVQKVVKTGRSNNGRYGLRYAGKMAFHQSPDRLFKPVQADRYRFIAFAADFLSDTLDNRTPVDGDIIQFNLWPEPPPDDFTSGWRGFNLLGKFSVDWSNEGYIESDFDMIADLGFNFVRLPVDYRTYTMPGDWTDFIESELQDIDNAVAWGQEYGIHVCLNLHRAPGYCVNPPEEELSLWSSAEARRVFAEHWAMFADRYKDIPVEALSFNLVNEPSGVDGPTYVESVRGAIEAIRDQTPERFIISDELNFGQQDQDDIVPFDVGLSPHFYNPMRLTHYMAEWIDGSDTWPEPTWPVYRVASYLYGSYKDYLQTPLVINGDFKAGTEIKILVHQVSTRADLRITADEKTIYQNLFTPGPGEGEWEEVIYREEWNCYQNIYNKVYSAVLEQAARDIRIRVLDGDWLTYNRLEIIPPAGSGQQNFSVSPGITDWGVPQAEYNLTPAGELQLVRAPEGFESYFTQNGFLQKWIDFKNQGIPVHVGEWGVYNKTPHDVTLAFMRDRLRVMKSAGLGWALWNFRGSFGILDSGRNDVAYENYRGHKLDRKMLDLLQKY